MPELPDIECAAGLLREHCVGHVVKDFDPIRTGGGKGDGEFDERVFANVESPDKIKKAVEGMKLEDVKRKGKYVWWLLSKNKKMSSLLFHFGMTGMFTIKDSKGEFHKSAYKSGEAGKKVNWPPKSTKMTARFDNGSEVAFVSQMRLASIDWFADKDIEQASPISDLAPDAYSELPSLKNFSKLITEQESKPLKAVLMEQDAVVSGLGNWTGDEICYQARIDPGVACSELSDAQIKAVYNSIKKILDHACKVGADVDKYPDTWIGRHRFNRGSKRKQEVTDESGDTYPVKTKTVAGRKSAYVPSLQNAGERS